MTSVVLWALTVTKRRTLFGDWSSSGVGSRAGIEELEDNREGGGGCTCDSIPLGFPVGGGVG